MCETRFGVGKPCPVCGAAMEARALPSSGPHREMAHCPNGNMLSHSTQAVSEAAFKAAIVETVTDLGRILTDPEHPRFDVRNPERPRPGLS